MIECAIESIHIAFGHNPNQSQPQNGTRKKCSGAGNLLLLRIFHWNAHHVLAASLRLPGIKARSNDHSWLLIKYCQLRTDPSCWHRLCHRLIQILRSACHSAWTAQLWCCHLSKIKREHHHHRQRTRFHSMPHAASSFVLLNVLARLLDFFFITSWYDFSGAYTQIVCFCLPVMQHIEMCYVSNYGEFVRCTCVPLFVYFSVAFVRERAANEKWC